MEFPKHVPVFLWDARVNVIRFHGPGPILCFCHLQGESKAEQEPRFPFVAILAFLRVGYLDVVKMKIEGREQGRTCFVGSIGFYVCWDLASCTV